MTARRNYGRPIGGYDSPRHIGRNDMKYGDAAMSGYCDGETLRRAREECLGAAGDPDVSVGRCEELREALRLKEAAYKYHEGY